MSDDYPIADLPTPDPSYGPGEVVGIQLDGLATNDDPFENAGIGVAYAFGLSKDRDGELDGCWLTDRVIVE